MKSRLSLSDWASLAEVVGTLGVLISLIFVIVGLDKSTDQAIANNTRALYEAIRNVELAAAADPSWSEIVIEGRKPESRLVGAEQYRYDVYVTAMIDIWDYLQDRFDDGLMAQQELEDWDLYFAHWTKRYLTPATWNRIKWQYNEERAVKFEQAILQPQAIQD